MLPRALRAPPGIPELASRERFVPLARCLIEGRAWSGHAAISHVRVSTDGGETWNDAELDERPTRWSWVAWGYLWQPEAAGRCQLACRARDEEGNEQPLAGTWNVGGYANNAVQRVPVTFREASAL
jgi:Mo-co oxidoreductase dimerisation domain